MSSQPSFSDSYHGVFPSRSSTADKSTAAPTVAEGAPEWSTEVSNCDRSIRSVLLPMDGSCAGLHRVLCLHQLSTHEQEDLAWIQAVKPESVRVGRVYSLSACVYPQSSCRVRPTKAPPPSTTRSRARLPTRVASRLSLSLAISSITRAQLLEQREGSKTTSRS